MAKLSAGNAASAVHEAVRTQLWPLPTLGVAIAVVLGVLLPYLEANVDDHLPGWLGSAVFGGDADAARTVLSAVAGSLITVTSLTFSLTVVTLQLASSQFSPRLLRTFAQDLFVQVTLAIFLATFSFSLTVLRSVRSAGESSSPFIPRLAVTLSYVLAVVSVIALVLFLAHLTRQIRVETMLHNVHHDATATLTANLERRDDDDARRIQLPLAPSEATTILAPTSGFLLRVDQDELVLRQLTDVVNKALSPGINDPTTAIHALGHISALLTEMMQRRLGPQTLQDGGGRARVVLDHPEFEHLIDLALTQPLHYGKADPQVLARLYELLGDLIWHAAADHGPAIDTQLRRLRRTVAAQDLDELDRQHLADLDSHVERRLSQLPSLSR